MSAVLVESKWCGRRPTRESCEAHWETPNPHSTFSADGVRELLVD